MKILEDLTREQVDSICLSYRHDFGLLSPLEKERLRLEFAEWIKAFEKEVEVMLPNFCKHCGKKL